MCATAATPAYCCSINIVFSLYTFILGQTIKWQALTLTAKTVTKMMRFWINSKIRKERKISDQAEKHNGLKANIIANNEYFKKKLLFTNTKKQNNFEVYQKVLAELKSRAGERNEEWPFTAIQLRTKFKKSVAECKKAAMTMKTSSGIKRFQDERGYGQWFN